MEERGPGRQVFCGGARERRGVPSTESGEIKGECGAGYVGERAGEVIEALRLEADGGGGDESLQGVGEADGWEEGAEEGGWEAGD